MLMTRDCDRVPNILALFSLTEHLTAQFSIYIPCLHVQASSTLQRSSVYIYHAYMCKHHIYSMPTCASIINPPPAPAPGPVVALDPTTTPAPDPDLSPRHRPSWSHLQVTAAVLDKTGTLTQAASASHSGTGRDISLSGISLSDASLIGISLNDISLSGIRLSVISLRGISLSDISRSDIILIDISLSSISLSDISLISIRRSDISLSGISLISIRRSDISLSGISPSDRPKWYTPK